MTGPLYTGNDLPFLITPRSRLRTFAAPEKKEILLLEDDPFFGPFLQNALARQGFGIELLASGERGLCLLSQRDYDFVICDIDLEEIDGIELYRHLTKERPLMGERFIFLSGSPHNEAIAAFIHAIRGAILYKPFHIHELLGYLT